MELKKGDAATAQTAEALRGLNTFLILCNAPFGRGRTLFPDGPNGIDPVACALSPAPSTVPQTGATEEKPLLRGLDIALVLFMLSA